MVSWCQTNVARAAGRAAKSLIARHPGSGMPPASTSGQNGTINERCGEGADESIWAARGSAVRALLLDPVPGGAERQPVQERARHLVRVPDERRGVLREHARQPEHRAAHAALLPLLGERGTDRR